MVAIVIAGLLTLGLIQIFGASRASSQMQEGLSRVQENGRFATQYLQRQLRMVGFMGCAADSARMAQASFVNHLSRFDGTVPGGNQYRFQRPIEAFTAGAMDPPAELAGIPFVEGSDVLILRVLSEESIPVISISKVENVLNVIVGKPDAAFLPTPGSTAMLAMQNCRSADVFAGSLNGTGPGSLVIANGAAAPNVYLDPTCGSCAWDFRISNAFLNAKPLVGAASLNAEIHRAEYIALFVRVSPTTGIPSLYVRRFLRNGTALGDPEELVEGVDNMQLRFGYDTSAVADGAIDEYRTAEEVVDGATDPSIVDNNWRRVLSVRVGLLMRSPDNAAVGVADGGDARTYTLLGVLLTPGNDGRMRQIYETTIALRNRLFNS
jgi:type IV pilus assembly protein PilW